MSPRILLVGAAFVFSACHEPLASFDDAEISLTSTNSSDGDEERLPTVVNIGLAASNGSCPALTEDAEVHFGGAQAEIVERGGSRRIVSIDCDGADLPTCEVCHRPLAVIDASLGGGEASVVEVVQADERIAVTPSGASERVPGVRCRRGRTA